MDLQNVKNITIPEGNVNTIHDKDGKLLWGRLAYDTKYAGDTFQQTYSGKNLFDNDSIALGYNWGGIGAVLYPYPQPKADRAVVLVSVEPSTTYRISLYQSEWYIMETCQADSSYICVDRTTNVDANVYEQTITTRADAAYIGFKFKYGSAGTTNFTSDMLTELKLQLELGSTTTSYEPYVGGTASPNPDYPQAVNVVTGTQTITISDGTNSQNYTVGLGSIELCKIGIYQDYIYRSGDDWYIHKTIKKYVFTGSESENWDNLVGTKLYRIRIDDILGFNINNVSPIVCNNYTPVAYSTISPADSTIDYGVALRAASAAGIGIKNKDINSTADFKIWLSNNNTIVYAPLATPTDTKITDSTLIGQLNAIHKWLTRYGYLSSITGNLPMIINQTNL